MKRNNKPGNLDLISRSDNSTIDWDRKIRYLHQEFLEKIQLQNRGINISMYRNFNSIFSINILSKFGKN